MTLKPYLAALLMVSAAFLTACEKQSDTYPITGEQCAPEDPVQTLDAGDCYIPPAVN